MKRYLSVVTLIMVILLATSAVQAARLDLKPGLWKIELGAGRLAFDDGVMEVVDYKGWSLIQYGANSQAGQFSLSGSTGLNLDVKVAEPADLEVAIQLADWAFMVVHKQTVDPAEGWVTLEVDLSNFDLSVINALCLQNSGADFAVRNVVTTPLATAGEGVQSAAGNLKIGGSASLDITARRVEVIPEGEITSPIAFSSDAWDYDDSGGGEAVFGANQIVVSDYPGWKWVSLSIPAALNLAEYDGIEFEVKVSEAHQRVQFIMLPNDDWGAGYQLYEADLLPEAGWVKVKLLFADVEHLEADLDQVTTILFQGGSGVLSLRTIDLLGEGVDQSLAFSDEWTIWNGDADLSFDNGTVTLNNYDGSWGANFGYRQPVDLSGFTGVRFDLKVESWSEVALILQPGWNEIGRVNNNPDDGWVTVSVDFEEAGLTSEYLATVNEVLLQTGQTDWALRNFVLLPIPQEPEELPSTYSTELERDYAVELNVAYTINDDWLANLSATLAEESFKVNLVEVKGTPDDLSLRFFAYGTGANLGDPLKAVQGSKFHENKTVGIDLRKPIYGGSGHLFLSAPVKPDPGNSFLTGGSYELPLPGKTEVQVLAATEFKAGPTEEKNPYVLGVVAGTSLDNGLALTAETVFSGKNGLGLYGKVAWKNLEAGITHAPQGLWTERGGYSAHDGYGTYHLSGSAQILSGLKAGFYFNQWYNHKKEDALYKNYLLKFDLGWDIADLAKLSAVFEQKKQLNTATEKYDKLENSKLLLTLEGDFYPGLDTKLIGIVTDENNEILKVPAVVARLTYTGLDNWTFVGEAGLAKAGADESWEHNLHARAKYQIVAGGTVELGMGKPTLNSGDNTVVNRSTERHHYTLKFKISF